MELAGEAVIVLLVALLAVAVGCLVGLYARRRWLSRQGGMFDMEARPYAADAVAGWTMGVARYSDDTLQWFKIFSLSWRPRRRFRQGEWTLVGTRDMRPAEASQLYADQRVVHIRSRHGEELELALDAPSVIALISWLEAAGPGAAKYGNTAE